MSSELIEKVSEALENKGLQYIVIGGQAVLIYGSARFTNDIDVLLALDMDGYDKISTICNELGLEILSDREFTSRTFVIPVRDKVSEFRVDFILSFTDFEKAAISRAKEVNVKDRKVKFASVEDLVLFKMFASRAIDLDDIKNILLINKSYDRDYILKWLTEFDKGSDTNLLNKFVEIEKNIK